MSYGDRSATHEVQETGAAVKVEGDQLHVAVAGLQQSDEIVRHALAVTPAGGALDVRIKADDLPEALRCTVTGDTLVVDLPAQSAAKKGEPTRYTFRRESALRASGYVGVPVPSLLAYARLAGAPVRLTDDYKVRIPANCPADLAAILLSREEEILSFADPVIPRRYRLLGTWDMDDRFDRQVRYTYEFSRDGTLAVTTFHTNLAANALFQGGVGRMKYKWSVSPAFFSHELVLELVGAEGKLGALGALAMRGDIERVELKEITQRSVKIGGYAQRKGGAFGDGRFSGGTLTRR